MTDHTFPTNAADLLNSKFAGKGDFFLLTLVEKMPSGMTVTVEDDFPIVVNKETLRDEVLKATGVKLPTRKEFSKGPLPADLTVDVGGLYTGASGGALWLRIDESEPEIYLIQNTPNKIPNGNRFDFPSGLISSRTVLETAYSAINRETGLLMPTADGGALIGVNFNLPPALQAGLSPTFAQAIRDARVKQEPNIVDELSRRAPLYLTKHMIWMEVDTQPYGGDNDDIKFSILGQAFKAAAHVLVDDKVKSANIHFSMYADLTGQHGIAADKSFVLDPEDLFDGETRRRNHGLFTLKEALVLDTIDAPRNYLKRFAAKM